MPRGLPSHHSPAFHSDRAARKRKIVFKSIVRRDEDVVAHEKAKFLKWLATHPTPGKSGVYPHSLTIDREIVRRAVNVASRSVGIFGRERVQLVDHLDAIQKAHRLLASNLLFSEKRGIESAMKKSVSTTRKILGNNYDEFMRVYELLINKG